MNQMEHNYKIKDYKRYEEPSSYIQTLYALDYPQSYPNKKEQDRFCDRFTQIHWKSEKRPASLPSQGSQLRYLRKEAFGIVANETAERRDEHWHRQNHASEVGRKIDEARREFARQVARERPKHPDYSGRALPLYKIIS